VKTRAWGNARAKVEREGKCRVCKATGRLEAAHTISRSYDRAVVRDDDIVPLCDTCHRKYDARTLDLIPYTTYAEQASAVSHVGISRALKRLGGADMIPRKGGATPSD
jgi:hypothetical protein